MSSGDSEPAPTYYFSGILFNPDFYTSSSSTYLTQTTAKKYFLTYPYAQGTETISNLISTAITYSSPASGSFFEIGTNQASGGTIRVGPTGSSAGVSVHCGNIDFKNNTINNATSATTGSISICDTQTSGNINIGTSTARTGNINIGNAAITGLGNNIGIGSALSNTSIAGKYIELAASTNGISLNTSGNMDLIATAYNIGTSLVSATNINIGTTGKTTTNLYGSFTVNNGMTLTGNNKITLSNGMNTTPAQLQLGYFVTGTGTATLINSTTPIQIGTMNAFNGSGIEGRGTFLVSLTINSTAFSGATTGYISISFTNVDSAVITGTPPKIGYSTSQKTTSWTGMITNIAGGGGILIYGASDVATNTSTLTYNCIITRIG